MDRAHRIGQTKPVQVFRLVTEDTVDVKVVERAQQKLKLDAMVVQQGRLADNDKKLSKEELLDTIRFGADKIFRSKESDITDDDIDIILEAGRKKTEEINSKISTSEKGDMLDFKLDGGMSSQVFEGTDYSAAARAQAQAGGALGGGMSLGMFIDPGKRERKIVQSYNESMMGMMEEVAADKRPKMPRHLKLPRMDDWQFYNARRLHELQDLELKQFEEVPL